MTSDCNRENLKFGLKFSVCTPYNFGASGNILTKLFQTTCREAEVLVWVQFWNARPQNFGRAKTSKSRRYFWQRSTLNATIYRKDRRIENRKKTLSPKLTFHSDLWHRAASRRALPYTSSWTYSTMSIKVLYLPKTFIGLPPISGYALRRARNSTNGQPQSAELACAVFMRRRQ